MNRRDLIVGAGCVAALGTAEYLRPRRFLHLLPAGRTLTGLIPAHFAGWNQGEGGDIVIPQTPGSLSSRLYSDSVARTYRRETLTVEDVMLLVTYGAMQSDLLQLHRPETCYPAVGYTIAMRRLVSLALAPHVTVPAVMLSATSRGRTEDIVYWTRLGETLPQTSGDQRAARLRAAIQGYVGDGVLVRASVARIDAVPKFAVLTRFLSEMVLAIAPANRAALIGSDRATAMVHA
jgi:EpsI family protein